MKTEMEHEKEAGFRLQTIGIVTNIMVWRHAMDEAGFKISLVEPFHPKPPSPNWSGFRV